MLLIGDWAGIRTVIHPVDRSACDALPESERPGDGIAPPVDGKEGRMVAEGSDPCHVTGMGGYEVVAVGRQKDVDRL